MWFLLLIYFIYEGGGSCEISARPRDSSQGHQRRERDSWRTVPCEADWLWISSLLHTRQEVLDFLRDAGVLLSRGPHGEQVRRRREQALLMLRPHIHRASYRISLKAPYLSHSKERTTRRPQQNHSTLTATVRFCKFYPKFGPVWVPYPESVDIWHWITL